SFAVASIHCLPVSVPLSLLEQLINVRGVGIGLVAWIETIRACLRVPENRLVLWKQTAPRIGPSPVEPDDLRTKHVATKYTIEYSPCDMTGIAVAVKKHRPICGEHAMNLLDTLMKKCAVVRRGAP